MMKSGMRLVVLLALCAVAVGTVAKTPRQVECRLPQYKSCYKIKMNCPPSCNQSCFLDCTLCTPVCACTRPGAVCQDPRFVGGDGIAFYFHGKKDGHFCLVTDNNLHINAHFIGKRKPDMKRDFTWVQSLGILFDAHKLYVAAMKTAAWDDTSDRLEFAFDGHPVVVPTNEGATWTSEAAPGVSITRTRATNAVTIEAKGRFAIMAMVVPITAEDSRVHKYDIQEDDCFAHLDLGFKFYDLSDGVDGVLGQTYRANYSSRAKVGAAMPVLGGDREFTSTSLFAADCASARFTGVVAPPAVGQATNGPAKEHDSLNCVGGAAGVGVFCKK